MRNHAPIGKLAEYKIFAERLKDDLSYYPFRDGSFEVCIFSYWCVITHRMGKLAKDKTFTERIEHRQKVRDYAPYDFDID